MFEVPRIVTTCTKNVPKGQKFYFEVSIDFTQFGAALSRGVFKNYEKR